MYIAPNTTIYILKNIPLGRDYENTVYYKDAATQAAAFMAYRKYTLTDYSYQRAQLGTIRVELKYENLYDCNYLMFKNTNFENKWFYCFITGIAYINNDVTEIYYEMDVMQTWCYDYQFLDSFVERRHARHDNLFNIVNQQPEGVELGKNYLRLSEDAYSFPFGFTLVATRLPSDTSDIIGAVRGGTNIATFSYLWVFTGNYTQILNVYARYQTEGITDAIVTIATVPCPFNTSGGVSEYETRTYTFTVTITNGQLYAHKVRNFKLFTYPYCKIICSNSQGNYIELRPELFTATRNATTGTITLTINATIQMINFPQPQARMVLTNYRQNGYSADADALANSLIYANFPIGAWSSDIYSTWWAQNKNNYIATMNAIERNYDTNMTVAQNNAAIAQRSAQAQGSIAKNSADVQLANATMSNNTALDNAINSYNAQLGSLGVNAGLSVGLNLLDLNFGSAAAGAVSGITNAQTMKASLQNATATNTTNNAIATNTAGTAIRNSQIAVSTALKNASTTLASSQLSGLTAKQNAIEALVAKKQDIQNVPPAAKGNAMADSLNGASNNMKFNFAFLSIPWQQVNILDSYFDMYGYALRNLQDADALNDRLVGRPYYCFLKTVGANIKGECNASDLQTIKGIYDNGITTWNALENVGNYSLNNEADHAA